MIVDITDLNTLKMIAGKIAHKQIDKGGVIYLSGDLGSGKTTFVQCFMQSLGYLGHVSSPSYALVNTYKVGKEQIAHADLYRLMTIDELDYLGWDLICEQSKVILVEWPELLTVNPTLHLFFKEESGKRQLEVTGATINT